MILLKDWQNTQFLHVFQEQLITGERVEDKGESNENVSGALPKASDLSLMENQLGAMVDLQQSAVFEEPFYIVVLERTNNNTIMHMWRLVIASHPPNPGLCCSYFQIFHRRDN